MVVIEAGHGPDRRSMGCTGTVVSEACTALATEWATSSTAEGSSQWHPLDFANGRPMERASQDLPSVPNVSSLVPAMATYWIVQENPPSLGQGSSGKRPIRLKRRFRGRLLRRGKKGGHCVGKTKRGKGTKIMAVADGNGLPLAIGIGSASPHEVKLIEAVLDDSILDELPDCVVGDKAYDSDKLDERLWKERGLRLIAPHRAGRRKRTQDGRELRRHRRRWKIERLFAWLQNFRRLTTRYERKAHNFLAFLHLGCALILLRSF
jgi:transposase